MKKSLRDLIAQAAKHAPHMPNLSDGGDYEIPAAGIARARFIGYYEVGKHEEEFKGEKKLREKVELVFELSGPNHPPRDFNGEKVPQRITARETYGLTDRNHFLKLFRQMNYSGKATHMAELLGEPFLVEIFHTKSKDGKKTYANLRGPNGYNIKGTTVQDPVSGGMVTVDVPPAMTDVKVFLWDQACKDMWDSIYIDGEYPEQKDEKTGEVTRPAKSKNVLQEKIMAASNWPEHPLYEDVKARPSVAGEHRDGLRVRPEGQSLKEWQDENYRRLMESLGRPQPAPQRHRQRKSRDEKPTA